MELSDLFGDVISRYTRAQAIEDGELVDATALAREAGLRFPCALTRAAWGRAVALPSGGRRGQDETGRLWDVVFLARCAIRSAVSQSAIRSARAGKREEPITSIRFVVSVRNRTRERVELKAMVGPGDAAEPVITIMLRDED